MSDPKKKLPVVVRMVSLALLGFAVAMTVIKVTGMIQHDIDLELRFSAGLRAKPERIELDVFDNSNLEKPLSITVFRTKPSESPVYRHRLALPMGGYRFVFRLFYRDQSQAIRVVKEVEVNRDESLLFTLP